MNRTRIGFFSAFILIAANTYANDIVVIRDAWIAEAPPASKLNAGYLKIENLGEDTITLLSVTSPAFEKIEIHRSVTANDITSMEYFSSIDIGPGQTIQFQPGGLHLMLYNANEQIKVTDIIPLTFRFSDDINKQTQAEVRKLDSLHGQHAHEHTTIAGSTMFDRIKVYYQHLLPQHFLSGLIYRLTRSTWQPLKNFLITQFIRLFDVDMSIAVKTDPGQYRHFNDFFTRELKPDARPIDLSADAIISPVDGAISQFGRISDGKIIQAKGRDYTVKALLGGDNQLAEGFSDGEFITIYLSPKDYHRIHMPLDGHLQSMEYIPGDLFSVNPLTTAGLDNLFARNERVVQVFATDIGKMALVMVGAIFVGSMETVWAGEITPATERKQTTTKYDGNDNTAVRLSKGAEMGRFNMGSTVILLFEKDRMQWDKTVQPDQAVMLGRKIAGFI